MKVLITGVDGFTGKYVVDELKSIGCDIFGLVHQLPTKPIENCIHVADLLDIEALRNVLVEVQPDWVIHLAAVSFVAHGDASAIYNTNVVGTRNLLQAIVDTGGSPKSVLLTSSANIYGNTRTPVIDESVLAQPANDYAVSKLAMEYVAKLYMGRLPIVMVRPFNYSGVGQAPNFLLPKIVGHFARKESVIELGNLNVARDFSDVRMVANCYRRLLQCPEAVGKTFNVCSEQAHTLLGVLDMMKSISDHSLKVEVNPDFVRENEVKSLRGSRAFLESIIGEVHNIPLQDTLVWMLENSTE